MRIFKTVLTLLLLLCLALGVLATFFLDQTALFLLRQSGMDEVRLQGLTIGLDSLTVSDFAASIVLPNGDRLSLETKDAVIRYDKQQLLQQGKAQTADIAELRLTLNQKTGADPVSMQLPDTIILLKEELRNRLPLSTLHIQSMRLLGDFPKVLLKKDLQLDAAVRSGELQLALSAQLGPAVVAELRMKSPDPGDATARIKLRAEDGKTVQGELQLTPDTVSGRVDFKVQELQDLLKAAGISLVLPDIAEKLSLQLGFPLGPVPEKAVSIKVVATDLDYLGLTSSSVALHLVAVPVVGGVDLGRESRVILEHLRGHNFDVKKLSLGLVGGVRYGQGQLTGKFLEGQKLLAKDMKMSTTEFGDIELGFEKPLQIGFRAKDWSVGDNTLLVAPLKIMRGGTVLESGPLRCVFSGMSKDFSEPGLVVSLNSPRLAFTDSEQNLSLTKLNGVVHLVGQQLTGQLQFVPDIFGGQVRLQFHHGLDSRKGDFRVTTPVALEFDGAGTMLSSLKKRWPYPFDLETGKLSLQLRGEYGPERETQIGVKVDLSEGSGFVQQFLFNGLSLKQEFRVYPDFSVQGGGSISLKHLAGGLDTYNIRTDLLLGKSDAGDLPTIQLNNFRASLLGGSLTSSTIYYDLNRPRSRFTVNIKGVSLVSLVNLIKMDDLLVTGDIDGTIPVRIESRDVTISGAELHSEGTGGEIRYTPTTMNPSGVTGYALRAVDNLQYNKLTVTADYAASGQLDLLIGIQGTSPGLNTSRPVHLNINAEQNLPALLKSLRFSKGLTDELDKRVKRHYN